MIMECIECHHLTEAELAVKRGGGYECPACSGPYLIFRLDLQISPDGRIIPCPGNSGGPGGFPELLDLQEMNQDNRKEI